MRRYVADRPLAAGQRRAPTEAAPLTIGRGEPSILEYRTVGTGRYPATVLRIRLRRVGKKKQPSYRIVVADARAPRDGRFVEEIGHYDPMTDPPTVVLQEEKAIQWLRHGAQPSDPVARILRIQGVLEKAEGS